MQNRFGLNEVPNIQISTKKGLKSLDTKHFLVVTALQYEARHLPIQPPKKQRTRIIYTNNLREICPAKRL